MKAKGRVYFVGAGPGDVELITIKGLRLIKEADCIIYDALANPDLLHNAKTDATLVSVPKRGGCNSTSQSKINDLIVEYSLTNKKVVRLKGGDPCLFGRLAEEIEACVKAKIQFEVVPGITSALAVSAYTGILLTNRENSSMVSFITGYEAKDKTCSSLNPNVLAKLPGSLVYYMGVSNIKKIVNSLIDNGRSPDTPVSIVENTTKPEQRIITASLGNVINITDKQKIKAPAIIVIGDAANYNADYDWYSNRPFSGKKIVITRDAAGNARFSRLLFSLGAYPIEFPCIKTVGPNVNENIIKALANLDQWEWVVFTSVNGIKYTFDLLEMSNLDSRAFGSNRIACVGEKTANELKKYGLKADFIPGTFTGEDIALEMSSKINIRDKKILLLRSAISDKKLDNILSENGAFIDDLNVYTVETLYNENKRTESMINEKPDWITFTSASTVRGFFEQVVPDVIISNNIKIASIGPVTSSELKKYGVAVSAEAREYTTDGIITAIKESKQ